MNREELDILKELSEQTYFGDLPFLYYADLIGKLLTAYEKEKEENEQWKKYATNDLENQITERNNKIFKIESELEKEKEKNKELSSQIDEHVYNGCDYELCNKKWLKKIKALMEKEDKLFFETKDVRHANRYKAYKELIEEE